MAAERDSSLFRRIAMTFPAGWRPFVAPPASLWSWPFWPTAGLATGRVEITREGVAFEPNWGSRVRGMRPGFVSWAAIREVGVFPRVGAFHAVHFLLVPYDLRPKRKGIMILTFSGPKLVDALRDLENKQSEPAFPHFEWRL